MQLLKTILALHLWDATCCAARSLRPTKFFEHATRIHPRAGSDDIKFSIKLEALRPVPVSDVVTNWAMPMDVGDDRPEHKDFLLRIDTGSDKVWVFSDLLPLEQQTEPHTDPPGKRKMYLVSDPSDERLDCETELYRYGSGDVRVRVLEETPLVIGERRIPDFPLGLAIDLHGRSFTEDARVKTGDGIIGFSPQSFSDFAHELDLAGTRQFLFNGRDGELALGAFGESTTLGWVKVVQPTDWSDWWYVPADVTKIGAALFDTGAEAIFLTDLDLQNYFAQAAWAGHYRMVGNIYDVDCDIASKPDLQIPPVSIELQVNIGGGGEREWHSFVVDVKWLTGIEVGTSDDGQTRFCMSLLQVLPGSAPYQSLVGLPFFRQYDVIFEASKNGKEDRIGVRSKQD